MTVNRFSKKSNTLIYDNIHFRSTLEVDCYKLLIAEGFDVNYEKESFELIPKMKVENALIYLPSRKTKKIRTTNLKQFLGTLQNAVYTPDFIMQYKDYKIFIETKGRANDAYPMRRKLFFHYLEHLAITTHEKFIFFEPHNRSQILETIKIIKEL